MQFFVFLDTVRIQPEEPKGRSGLTVEEVFFGIVAVCAALFFLGLYISSTIVTVASGSVLAMSATTYLLFRVFERFVQEQSTF